jgi:hypothetical protein
VGWWFVPTRWLINSICKPIRSTMRKFDMSPNTAIFVPVAVAVAKAEAGKVG